MKYAAAVLFVCATFVLSSVPSFAASSTRDTVKVNVPFDFTINGKMFAPGQYTIARLSDENIGTLVIRGVDSNAVMTFQTVAGSADSGTPIHLEFVRNGATYSLVTVDGEIATYGLAPTRSRRELAKHSNTGTVQATP